MSVTGGVGGGPRRARRVQPKGKRGVRTSTQKPQIQRAVGQALPKPKPKQPDRKPTKQERTVATKAKNRAGVAVQTRNTRVLQRRARDEIQRQRVLKLARSGDARKLRKVSDFRPPKRSSVTRAAAGVHESLLRLQPAPLEVARATVEDPVGVAKGTGRGLRDTVTGIPGGIAKLATDPKGAAEDIIEDYKRRYGTLARGDAEEFRKRIKEEGAAGELLDALVVAPPAGAAAGATARAGALGAKAQRTATKPRPKLRTSGGRAKQQRLSENLITVAAQRTVDATRRKAQARRVKKAEKTGGRVDVVQPRAGEVVPVSRRLARRAQKRDVARAKGHALMALKSEQGREVHRGVTRDVASLSRVERRAFKYAVQLGLTDPKSARIALKRRRGQILRERTAKGTDIPEVLRKTNDELPVIESLIANAERAFTPRLRAVADAQRTRDIRVARRDPSLTAEQRLLRRHAPQAEMLGVRRGEETAEHFDYGATVRAISRRQRKAERRQKKGAQTPTETRQAAVVEAVTAAQEAEAKARLHLRSTQKRLDLERRSGVGGGEGHPDTLASAGRLADRASQAARDLGEAMRAFEAEFGKLPRDLSPTAFVRQRRSEARKKLVAPIPVTTVRQGDTAPARATVRKESATEFVRRVKEEAKRKGLTDPAYFPSEKRPTVRYSNYAVGGTKAVADDKTYTGALFRTGREDRRAQVAGEGLARNIKRKHNWNLVADNFEKHSFDWGRNKTVGELLDELDRRGIDQGSVAFWNPRKYREVRQAHDTDVERTGLGEEPVAAGLTEAVDESAKTVQSLSAVPDEFKNTKGWSVVPKAVYDEIHQDTRPSGPVARSLDIAKGKQSRVLLGLLNIPWLQMQVVSNALLTGFSRTGPRDVVRAQVWWRKLSDDERAAVEPYIGVGPFHGDIQQTKLGASTNAGFVNSYRALKQTAFFQRLGKLNPLDVLFRADNAQNNFFRKAVLYSQLKREAYQRMNKSANKIGEAQNRLVQILGKEPTAQLHAIVRDKDAMERHAQYVNDMLGDYVTYTAGERRIFARNVMFYGFLRFSLRFAFYTMPTRHPVTTGIVGNLGRLNAEEVRELLGGDELPWAFGKLYYTKDGELAEVDLSRANPASNIVTSLRAPKDVMRALPPVFVALVDQVYEESSFTGKDYATGGRTRTASKEAGYSGEDRARIFLAQMLRLAAPYRIAEEVTQKGPEGDDTLLFDRRPTRYKRPDIVRSIAQDTARREERGTGNLLLEELVPGLPRESRDREIAESLRSRSRPAPKRAKRRSRSLDDYRGGESAPTSRPKTLDDYR